MGGSGKSSCDVDFDAGFVALFSVFSLSVACFSKFSVFFSGVIGDFFPVRAFSFVCLLRFIVISVFKFSHIFSDPLFLLFLFEVALPIIC